LRVFKDAGKEGGRGPDRERKRPPPQGKKGGWAFIVLTTPTGKEEDSGG